MLPDKLNNCSWDHLHGNFHMPLAEKPITSCQAMNLSPNIRPGWLLSGCGGNDDSASTSASCLCVVTGLQGCMSAGGAVEWLPHLCKKLPRGEMGTAAVRLPINSVQLGIERMSAFFGGRAFQCRCGMKCCDQFWDIVAFFFFGQQPLKVVFPPSAPTESPGMTAGRALLLLSASQQYNV